MSLRRQTSGAIALASSLGVSLMDVVVVVAEQGELMTDQVPVRQSSSPPLLASLSRRRLPWSQAMVPAQRVHTRVLLCATSAMSLFLFSTPDFVGFTMGVENWYH